MFYFLLPIKFKCTCCQIVYMQHIQSTKISYPTCPKCAQQGQMLGRIEPADFKHHPLTVAQAFIKAPWHKLNT